MKLSLIFIFFLAHISSFSQTLTINKLWVGDANNYLKVDTDAIRIEYSYEFQGIKDVTTRAYKYFIIGDTLRIMESEFKSGSNHDFLIKNLSNDELKLISLNPNSRILAFAEIPIKVFTFRAQQKVYTDTINFEEILFSSTTCYGRCPAMSFQIDNKKQMNFIGGKFAIKQGSYAALLPDQLYEELLETLAISELDRLENTGRFNIDAPTYMLEVHYNGKVKFIKSAFLPYVTNELLNLLLEIPKRVELKDAKPLEIKFSH